MGRILSPERVRLTFGHPQFRVVDGFYFDGAWFDVSNSAITGHRVLSSSTWGSAAPRHSSQQYDTFRGAPLRAISLAVLGSPKSPHLRDGVITPGVSLGIAANKITGTAG